MPEMIGTRIKAARESLGISNAELARKVGASPHALMRVELGHVSGARLDFIKNVSRELKVPPQWVAWGRVDELPRLRRLETEHLRSARTRRYRKPAVKTQPTASNVNILSRITWAAIGAKVAWEVAAPTIKAVGDYIRTKISNVL